MATLELEAKVKEVEEAAPGIHRIFDEDLGQAKLKQRKKGWLWLMQVFENHMNFTWKDKGKYHGFWEIVCDQVQKSWFDYDN